MGKTITARTTERSPLLGHGTAYARIIRQLTDDMRDGRLPVGSPVPSEIQLARSFGVSTGTAKCAMSKMADMGVVRRIPRVGTFVARMPDAPSGFVPVTDQPKVVYVVVPCLPDSYLLSIVQGAEKTARPHGIDLVLRVTDHDAEVEQVVLRDILAQRRASGVVIFPVDGHVCCDELLRMRLDKLPLVVVDREYQGLVTDCVVPDHIGGARLAMQYLLGLGHVDIGFVSVDVRGCSASEARYRGYIDSLAHSRSWVRRGRVLNWGEISMPTPEVTESVRAVLRRYLVDNPGMTAVFAANDYLAVAVFEAAASLGMRVPTDLSVVGFSNNEVGLRCPVPITTIEHRKDSTGGLAMELLLARMDDSKLPYVRQCLAPELLVRQSSGSPSAGLPAVAIG